MAKPKKDGKRATGVQGKSGYLYIISYQHIMKDGVKVRQKQWISTGLKDTAENVKKASEMRARQLNTKHTDVSTDRNITLADYIDNFLNKKKREVSDTTSSSYFYRGNSIKEFFGDIKVKEITESMVECFLDELFEERHLQQRTVKDIKVLLSTILDKAVKEGIVAYNPAKEVVINKKLALKYAKEKNTEDEFFSYGEAQTFLDNIKELDCYEMYYVALFFGLRREELLGLRWSAIDFNSKTMSINHTVTKGMTVNYVNSTKTDASNREYPLTDEQIEMFRQLKTKEDFNRKLFGNCYIENEYIFKHANGKLYYPDYPTKTFKGLIIKMPELPQGITLHGLRSSCVSILVHQGMDVKSIQKWVGHADYETTLKIYAKVKDKEAKKEISDKMTSVITLKEYTDHNIKQ